MSLPVWGCPWHGLVRDSQLTLPDGTLKPYLQPEASKYTQGTTTIRPHDTYGSTFRHAAGMPAVVRSAEEQAIDTAAGYQFRNEAILSGGRQHLFRRVLDGWIYVDPGGARWWVRCADLGEQNTRSLASPFSVTVVLERFGVFGGPAEFYSYTVSLPLEGIGGSGSAHLIVDAIKPDGSAAIINAHTRSFSRRMSRRPEGFLELSISGPGAAAVVSAAVVRTNAQSQQIDAYPIATRLYYDGSLPREWTETPNGGTQAFSLEGIFAWSSNRVLALWYDSLGQIEEVTLRIDTTLTYSAPAPPLDAGSGAVLPFATDSSMTGTVQLLVGGTVMDSIPISATLSLSASEFVGDWTFSAAVAGVTMNGTSQITWGPKVPFPDIFYVAQGFFSNKGLYSCTFSPEGSPELTGSAEVWFFASVFPYWYSRQVVGLELSTENGAGEQPLTRRWRFRPPATPAGVAAGSVIDLTTPNGPIYYGSHDPYSGEAVWGQSVPVCYI